MIIFLFILSFFSDCTVGAPLSEYSIFYSGLRHGAGATDNEGDSFNCNAAENSENIFRFVTFRSWKVLGKLSKLTNQKLESLRSELLQFYKNYMKVSLQQSVTMASGSQGTNMWRRNRDLRITASKARS